MTTVFRCALDHPNARLPIRADTGAAGYDLYAAESTTIDPASYKMIDTGIVIEIPQDCYARIAPRSGLAAKNGIDVLAGVVDSSYRGHIRVILMNNGQTPFHVEVGDRIAQMIFERIYVVDEIQCVDIKELTETQRGDGGFGSTGTK